MIFTAYSRIHQTEKKVKLTEETPEMVYRLDKKKFSPNFYIMILHFESCNKYQKWHLSRRYLQKQIL